jgi:hypothetical protein
MQDGEKVKDAQFHTNEETGITAGECTRISKLKSTKPICTHPLENTTSQRKVLAILVTGYKASFDTKGVCCLPSMVCRCSATFANIFRSF